MNLRCDGSLILNLFYLNHVIIVVKKLIFKLHLPVWHIKQ
jgi:hypothetical protein